MNSNLKTFSTRVANETPGDWAKRRHAEIKELEEARKIYEVDTELPGRMFYDEEHAEFHYFGK